MMASPATPPTTAPAIAPEDNPEEDGEDDDVALAVGALVVLDRDG